MQFPTFFLALTTLLAVVPSSVMARKEKKSANALATCSIGVVQVQSTRSFDETYKALVDSLLGDASYYISKEFDAVKVAAMAGVTVLQPNRVVIFGNAALYAPLLEADPNATLDMPQKIHVYQSATDGKTYVGYNSPEYLEARYKSLHDVDALAKVTKSLKKLVANAAGVDVASIMDKSLRKSGEKMIRRRSDQQGRYIVTSKVDFSTTWDRIVAAVPAYGLLLVATVDHQIKASEQGIVINPSRLMMMCKPAFDATFTIANQCSVIDFPLKLSLIETDKGTVEVSINEFGFLKQRHYVSDDAIDGTVYDDVVVTVRRLMESVTAA